jgi:hypothetical protein
MHVGLPPVCGSPATPGFSVPSRPSNHAVSQAGVTWSHHVRWNDDPGSECSGQMVTAEFTGGEGAVLQTGSIGPNRWVSGPRSGAAPWSARVRRDTNRSRSRPDCGLLRRKPGDSVVWSPSLVMSLQIDTATFIPEASSASGSVVAKGSGSHHDTRATGTNRASSRVRSQLRLAV